MAVSSDIPGWPRLLSFEQLRAYLGNPKPSSIYDWRKRGLIPTVLKGTTKTDRFLLDQHLNKQSGLTHESTSEYDKWKSGRDARQPQGHKEGHS